MAFGLKEAEVLLFGLQDFRATLHDKYSVSCFLLA